MAETKAGKERVYVHPYTKKDGTHIGPHYRTPPCPPCPAPKRKGQ
jgi:hypothetical protein